MPSAAAQFDMFRHLVEAGSIGACARRVGRPPEAIADAIAALEARLGHGLVEIDGGQVRLTAVGEKTWEALQTLEQGDGGADRSADAPVEPRPAPRAAATRAIRVACSDTLLRTLGDRLAEFEAAHPDVAIELDRDSLTLSAIARGFATGRIDIALFHAAPGASGPPSTYLWSDPLSLFVAQDHPLAALDYVSPGDVAAYPPVLPRAANPVRGLIEDALRRGGFGDHAPAAESDDLEDRFTALVDPMAGDAPPYLPLFGQDAQMFAGSEGIVRLRVATHQAALDVRCALCPGLYDDPLVGALADTLSGQAG